MANSIKPLVHDPPTIISTEFQDFDSELLEILEKFTEVLLTE